LDELRQSKPPATKCWFPTTIGRDNHSSVPEQDRHRWSTWVATQIPLLLYAQAVVIAAAAVSAARFSLRIRGIADWTSSCDSCSRSAVIRLSF
jgi:hypothetical protein